MPLESLAEHGFNLLSGFYGKSQRLAIGAFKVHQRAVELGFAFQKSRTNKKQRASNSEAKHEKSPKAKPGLRWS